MKISLAILVIVLFATESLIESLKKTALKINGWKETALGPVILKYWPRFITPNHLSYFKFVAAFFIALMCFEYNTWRPLIAVLFITAMIADLLDGVIARRLNMITKTGALIDPLADKATTMPLLIRFALNAGRNITPFWPLIILDSILMLMAFVGRSLKLDVSSGIWGKCKLHLLTYGFVILIISENNVLGIILLWLAALLAVASIIGHLRPFFKKMIYH